jgi:hypothetical protein
MADFLVRNWGNLASVGGLFFSILAFVFSKRASTAAREARDAAMRQSLGEDMNGAARIAKEIVTYLRVEKTEMALLRVADLMNHTRYLTGRWGSRLAKKSKDNLVNAREHLRSMHDVLSRNAGEVLMPEERTRVAHAAQQVSEILSEEHGMAVRAVEIRGE